VVVARYVVAVYETASQLIAIDLFNWSVLVFGLATCAFGIGALLPSPQL
jgi:hypothetical protein